MRILFVTQVDLDRAYGGARHVSAVAAELARLEHEVTLVAPGRATVPGVRRVRPFSGLRAGATLEAAQAALSLREVFANRPDAAYVRISASTLLVPWALRGSGVPVVLELNGAILAELEHLGRSRTVVSVVRRNLRSVVRIARALVAVEDVIADHARRELGARHVEVIENGADLASAVPGEREPARRRLDLPLDRKIVAFAGTLTPEVRLDLLLEAVSGLSGVDLVLAGGGPRSAELETSRPGVRWLGPRTHDEAVDLIRAADICVNVRDGWIGMKCLEYAALGRRFVTFEERGLERLVQLYPNLDAVHVVRDRTSTALRSGIIAALEAEHRLGPLPGPAVAAARDRIGWEHTARGVAYVLESAIR
ncbi:MAG: glycosyltransferase family 4 protein [Deltaproteobacteria bacterium]|nr:glycosyltransferase family 4 protein [Deltaproteobacteria bacterium]